MKIIVMALMILCNNDQQCEKRVYECIDPFYIEENIEMDDELESELFQFCLDNYVMGYKD